MPLQSLGADEVVNYREQDFAEIYKDPSKHFDAIVDLIGGTPIATFRCLFGVNVWSQTWKIMILAGAGETEVKSYGLLKPGGTFAHILNTGTSQERVDAAKEWTDKKYALNLFEIFKSPRRR